MPAWHIVRTAACALQTGIAATVLCAGPAVRAKDPPLEYQVKAAFLLNFARFVEWPAAASDANAPFHLCIYGQDPFGTALDQIVEGEKIGGRQVVVKRLGHSSPEPCQMVFVAKGGQGTGELTSSLPRGVLTVGEGEEFLRDGGMIAFIVEDRRVRFDINRSAAQRSNLKLSSKLLQVARSVEK